MKKYFVVTDSNREILGAFEFSGNLHNLHSADSTIMRIVADHYCADDCELDKGFKPLEFYQKPIKLTGRYWEEASDREEFEIHVDRLPLYMENAEQSRNRQNGQKKYKK